VDDNITDRILAEEAFGLLKQPCTLVTAACGAEALKYLTASDTVLPDLVLLDVNMPGMDGFTVLSRLKQHPVLGLLPVIMLTTSTADEDVAQAYALQASGYVPKVMSFEGFIQQLGSLMEFWTLAKTTTWPTFSQGTE
jgi:CheY-like chemotaxis protein